MSNINDNDIIIFEKEWRNSRGEIDGWRFYFVESNGQTNILWSYHALFDANTNEESSGAAEFSYHDFKQFLEEYANSGFAELLKRDKKSNGANGSIELKRKDEEKVILHVSPDYFGDGIRDVVDSFEFESVMFSKFGIAKPIQNIPISVSYTHLTLPTNREV